MRERCAPWRSLPRERDYVRAARIHGRSLVEDRHSAPDSQPSILVIDTVLGVISGINSETACWLHRLGIKAPDTSLGYILAGLSAMLSAPCIVLIPSVCPHHPVREHGSSTD